MDKDNILASCIGSFFGVLLAYGLIYLIKLIV